MRPITYHRSEIDIQIALALGWQWWACSKDERGDDGKLVEMVVRFLRPPDFDHSRWEDWAKSGGKVYRRADGTEPIERIQCTGDAMRASDIPCWSSSDEDALQLLHEAAKRGWFWHLHGTSRRCIAEINGQRASAAKLAMAIAKAFVAAANVAGAGNVG